MAGTELRAAELVDRVLEYLGRQERRAVSRGDYSDYNDIRQAWLTIHHAFHIESPDPATAACVQMHKCGTCKPSDRTLPVDVRRAHASATRENAEVTAGGCSDSFAFRGPQRNSMDSVHLGLSRLGVGAQVGGRSRIVSIPPPITTSADFRLCRTLSTG